MRLRAHQFSIVIIFTLVVSTQAWAGGCGCTPISMMNAPMIESFFPLGGPGVDNTTTSSSDFKKPFSVNFGLGVLYDSRVGAESNLLGTNGISDVAAILKLNASYAFPIKGLFGFRVGYTGSAQFFQDREEFNVMNQSFIVEPNHTFKQGVFSLPLSFSSIVEDKKRDAYLYTVTPTYTLVFSDFDQAMSVYAIFSTIRDMDSNFRQNEDGELWGYGVAYSKLLTSASNIRLSLEFANATYEAPVYTYNTYTINSYSSDDREDKTITAGLRYNYRINASVGLYTNYSFIHSTSNAEVNNYDRNILEVGISYRY